MVQILDATKCSITANEADRFNRSAAHRDRLWCTQPSGLFLLKVKRGCSWRVKYRDVAAKAREVTIGRYPELPPKDAKQRATHIINNLGIVDPLAEKQKKRLEALAEAANTVGAFLEGPYTEYQLKKKKQGPHTIAIIRNQFAALLDRPMMSLGKSDIRTWQRQQEGKGRKHDTLTRSYGALKTMLNRAQQEEVIPHTPLRDVHLDPPPVTEHQTSQMLRRPLTNKELTGLASALAAFNQQKKTARRNSRAAGKAYLPDLESVTYAHWFVPFCQLAQHLGMRPGDLYTLEWEHINFPFKRLVKIPEKTRHHPNPQQLNLPLTEEVLNILTDWHRQQGQPATGLVFPARVKGQPLDKNAHQRHWRAIKKLTNAIAPDLQFYALRHNFISTLVGQGVPLLVAAKLAGHKSARMIENHYGHLCPAVAADAMQVIGARLTGEELSHDLAS